MLNVQQFLRVFWRRYTREKLIPGLVLNSNYFLILEKNSLVSFRFPAFPGPKYAFIYAVVCREGMLFGRGCIGRGFSLYTDVEFLLGVSIKRLASDSHMDLVTFNHISWP